MDATIPAWAWNLGMGALIVAWLEFRFTRKGECALKHAAVERALEDGDSKFEERKKSTHDLRDELQKLVTRVALVQNDQTHLTMVVESIAAKVGANGFTPRSFRKTPLPLKGDEG